jgi:hypothetical protein
MSSPSQGQDKDKQEKRRYARSPEEFVFNTNTDESDYPLYVTEGFELWHKKHPQSPILFSANVSVPKKQPLSVSCDSDEAVAKFSHIPLYKEACNALIDITGRRAEPTDIEVVYEVYKGDFEEHVGEASAEVVKLVVESPFSLVDEKKSFAVVYNWLKRLGAKYPNVAKYAYVSKVLGSKLKYSYAVLVVKLVKPSQELEKLFKAVAQTEPAEPEPVEAAAEEEEGEARPPISIDLAPRELELELPALPAAPAPVSVPADTTAVAPQATAQAPTAPARQELVKVYLLAMRLPSKYAVQKVRYEGNREIREFDEVAGKLETLRREAYAMVSRAFAYTEEYGTWIAVTEDAVEEARKVSEFVVKRLEELGLADRAGRYTVRAVPIYLEPEEAKRLLEAAVRGLSEDASVLEEKIREAQENQKRRMLARLQRDLEYRRRLLEAFKKFLAQINA